MMKTNVQVKDEPVELQVDKLLRLYAYQTTRTKSIGNQEQERKKQKKSIFDLSQLNRFSLSLFSINLCLVSKIFRRFDSIN